MALTRRFFFLAVFSLACAQAGGPVSAADGPASLGKVGIVNLNRVFKEYGGTKATEAHLEQLSRQKQAEREKFAEEIRGMRDEMVLLNAESRNKQRDAIDEKLKDLAQFDQQALDQLRGKREQAIDKLLKEIEGIVTNYARQNGYDLILTDRAALFFAEGIDVTDQILTLLNNPQGKKSS